MPLRTLDRGPLHSRHSWSGLGAGAEEISTRWSVITVKSFPSASDLRRPDRRLTALVASGCDILPFSRP